MSEQGYFKADDGVKLFYRFHRHSQERAVMVIVHGHGEHSGRYEKFSRIFQDLPISLALYDARGTGRSEGSEVYVSSFQQFVSDLTVFRNFLRDQFGVRRRIVLLGHSLGGLVSVYWAMGPGREEIDAMILSSPCLGLNLPPALICFNSMLNRFVPGFIYKNPVYPPHLSHNPEEIELYKQDPYIKRKISVRLLSEMITYGRKLSDIPEFQFPFPLYILMAGMEKVVDKTKTRIFFERIKAPRKELFEFEGFYHEIFNELGQEKVFDTLKTCLDASGALKGGLPDA